jgi:opacity protein-like surface antigen
MRMKLKHSIVLTTLSLVLINFTSPLLALSSSTHVPNGLYLSLGGSAGGYNMPKITAERTSYPPKSIDLAKNQSSHFKYGYSAAIGYAIDTSLLRIELEYLNTATKYHVYPLFKEPLILDSNFIQITGFQGKAKNSTIFVNGYLDFTKRYSQIIPYFMMGGGFSSNAMKWIGLPSGFTTWLSGTTTKSSFAFQGGVGSLIRVTDNIFADLSFRLLSLGKVSWKMDIPTTIPISYQMQSKNLFGYQAALSVTWFFGNQANPGPTLINDMED